MKQFLLFLFVLLFPVIFVLWLMCAVTWQIVKDSISYINKTMSGNGTNIS